MNYATIKRHDVANGPGVRVSLFVSGCTHCCKGCFNQEAWDFSYGEPFTDAVAKDLVAALAPAYIKGFSLLGGEPFEPENQAVLLPLMKEIRRRYPDKTIWCYTGYDYEQDILTGKLGKTAMQMLSYLDVLVDGEFQEELKNPNLRFKGSANQRMIDVPKSLAADEVIPWEDEFVTYQS